MGYNGSSGVIVWLKINLGYILLLNLHDIEAGASLNCDGFSVVPEVDEYYSLLIFLHFFLSIYVLLFHLTEDRWNWWRDYIS